MAMLLNANYSHVFHVLWWETSNTEDRYADPDTMENVPVEQLAQRRRDYNV